MHYFHPRALEIKYVQYDKNTCVLSSLSSALFDANEHVAEHYVFHDFNNIYHVKQLVILIGSSLLLIFSLS